MLHFSQYFVCLNLLRYYLWLVTLSISIPTAAQVQKGQFHIGGEFQASTNLQQKFYINTNVQISAGLMTSSKWSIGLGLPIQYNGGNGYNNIVVPGIAPFVRRYIDLKSNFFLILHAQLGSTFNSQANHKSIDFSARFSPAVNYFISPRFGVEASFAEVSHSFHSYNTNDSKLQWQDSKFWFYVRPRFSLRYYFLKKGSEAIALNN